MYCKSKVFIFLIANIDVSFLPVEAFVGSLDMKIFDFENNYPEKCSIMCTAIKMCVQTIYYYHVNSHCCLVELEYNNKFNSSFFCIIIIKGKYIQKHTDVYINIDTLVIILNQNHTYNAKHFTHI